MTKQKPTGESDKEQSERFREAVRDRVAAGELDPTEADKRLAEMVSSSTKQSPNDISGETSRVVNKD